MKKAFGSLRGRQTSNGSLVILLLVTIPLLCVTAVELRAADQEPAAAKAHQAEELLKLFQEEGDITNSLGAVMVWIPAGYRVAKTEVTQAQYQQVMGSNPSRFKGSARPVESVSPDQAREFCKRLTEREQENGTLPNGFAYGLPGEQEFDTYVAETSLDTAFVSLIGDRLRTATVGSLPANPLGLYDVRGNVWEWCQSNVARGGSYQSHEDYLAPSFRFVGDPGMKVMDIGFRVVLRGSGS